MNTSLALTRFVERLSECVTYARQGDAGRAGIAYNRASSWRESIYDSELSRRARALENAVWEAGRLALYGYEPRSEVV